MIACGQSEFDYLLDHTKSIAKSVYELILHYQNLKGTSTQYDHYTSTQIKNPMLTMPKLQQTSNNSIQRNKEDTTSQMSSPLDIYYPESSSPYVHKKKSRRSNGYSLFFAYISKDMKAKNTRKEFKLAKMVADKWKALPIEEQRQWHLRANPKRKFKAIKKGRKDRISQEKSEKMINLNPFITSKAELNVYNSF